MDDELSHLKDETLRKFSNPNNPIKNPERPIDEKIIKDILKNGSDIVDDDEDIDDRPKLEIFAHKMYKYLEILAHYIFALCSILLAIFIIYYTNFFYNLYFNEKVDKLYEIFSGIFFLMVIMIICYISFYLPLKGKTEEEIDKEMDDIIPYCTLIAILGILSLIISIWDVYYIYSIPIVFIILWAFIMTANFAPRGILGNIIFFLWIILIFLSPKFIEGKGHTYY